MPIRFACQHCDSVLSVSSRKLGQQVTCPKCRQPTTVPNQSAALPAKTTSVSKTAETLLPSPTPLAPPPDKVSTPQWALPPELADLPAAPLPTLDELPVFATDESDEVTWHFETESGDPYKPGTTDEKTDFDRISLPRYVLYGQGVLLLALALVSLTLGILIGRGTAPRVAQKSNEPQPCQVSGNVSYKTSGGSEVPDAGAVVVALPQNVIPRDKAPVEGLRPDDPMPLPDQQSLVRIKLINGDYARTDGQGYFKLHLPETGNYFLLVISKHAKRKASDRLDPTHLSQLGRYILPAPDVIGDRQYRWLEESIKRDKEYKFTFD